MMIATLPTASSGKSAPGAAELSPAIARELRSSFGKEAIVSPRDERLTRLHGYYCQGWERVGVVPDIQQTLGKSWQEIDTNTFALDNGGGVRQVVAFDAQKGETRLSSIMQTSMISTEHETLVLDRQGKVRKEAMTAH